MFVLKSKPHSELYSFPISKGKNNSMRPLSAREAKVGSIGSVATLTVIIFILMVLGLVLRTKTYTRLPMVQQSKISTKIKGYTTTIIITGLLGLTVGASSTLGLVALSKKEKTSEPVNIAGIFVCLVLLVCAIILGISGPSIYNASIKNENDADKKKMEHSAKEIKSWCYGLMASAIILFLVPVLIVYKDYKEWKKQKQKQTQTAPTAFPAAVPPTMPQAS